MGRNTGEPITNDTSSLTVGENGPVLLQDINLIEEMANFDRENARKSCSCRDLVLMNYMILYLVVKM
ncbi:catalase [Clostridium gasigenes]|uniref:catalase n=1 Tax=Clostridium gasigenes TaxID=94869 RepID=UPI001A91E3CE|nr:catalase [Clostridium gasigenes]MBU3131393.1 catalase [Clostridium gasigenes]QSW18641.1 catalase [Clostridium gasigenes]